MRLRVEEREGIKIFFIDNSNSEDEFDINARTEWKIITDHIKAKQNVLFCIEDIDMDGTWTDALKYWIHNCKILNIFCPSEQIFFHVCRFPQFMDGEVNIYRSEREALTSMKKSTK